MDDDPGNTPVDHSNNEPEWENLENEPEWENLENDLLDDVADNEDFGDTVDNDAFADEAGDNEESGPTGWVSPPADGDDFPRPAKRTRT